MAKGFGKWTQHFVNRGHRGGVLLPVHAVAEPEESPQRLWLRVTDQNGSVPDNASMPADALVRDIEGFLSGSHDAVVIENGAVLFDLTRSKYSISGERDKCVLHLW